MSARSERDKTTGKPKHSTETLQRIAEAREHYRTRASRRPTSLSQADLTIYGGDGVRLPIHHTITLRTHARRNRMPNARVVMGLDRELRQVLGI